MMEELIPLVTSAQEVWKEFNFEQKKEAWDTNVKGRLENFKDESLRGKRKLADHTKELRAMSDEDKIKGMGPLIRAYQEEIDKANQRCVFTEALHSSMWSVLQRAQDPLVLLNTTMKAIREGEAEKQSIAAENFRVRKELAATSKKLEALETTQPKGDNTQKGLEEKLNSALKQIAEMEEEKKVNIEQYKKAATSLSRVGELESANGSLKEDLDKAKVDLDGLQTQIKELTQILEKAEAEKGSLKDLLEKVETEKGSLKDSLEKASETVATLEKENLDQEMKVNDLQEKLEDLQASANSNEAIVSELQADVADKNGLLEQLNKSIEELKANQASSQNEDAERSSKELVEIKEQLKIAIAAKEIAEKQCIEQVELVQRAHQLETELEEANKSNQAKEEREADVAEQETKIATLLANLEAEKKETEGANEKVNAMEELVEALKAKVRELEESYEPHDPLLEQSRAEVARLHQEVDELQRHLKSSGEEMERLRSMVAERAEGIESEKAEAARAMAMAESAKAEIEDAKAESEKAYAEVENAKAEVEKAKAEAIIAKEDAENAKAEAENIRQEAQREKEEAESRIEVLIGAKEEAGNRLEELQLKIQSMEADAAKGSDEFEQGTKESEAKLEEEVASLKTELQKAEDKVTALVSQVDEKEQTIIQLQIEMSSKEIELNDALKGSQQFEVVNADNAKRIAELEKKQEEAISDNLLNQEVIQQQLHTIAQLKGEEETKGTTPRGGPSNFQDQMVEELTSLVATLRENNEKLTAEVQAYLEECDKLRELVRGKDDRIATLMENEDSQDLSEVVEELQSSNQQLSIDLENKSSLLEHLEGELNDREAQISKLTERNALKKKALKEKEERLKELEENDANVRKSIGTAELHTVELTRQVEQLNDTVRQLEEQLDQAKEEGKEKDDRMSATIKQLESEISQMDEQIKALETKGGEKELQDSDKLAEKEREIGTLKAQNGSLKSDLQRAEQIEDTLQTTARTQAEKIAELEQRLIAKEEDFTLRGKSNDAEIKRRLDSVNASLEYKDSEINDIKAKHVEEIKKLVSQNAELLIQLERHESQQSDLERNVTELANSYRVISERAETDALAKDQAQEALSASKVDVKALRSELDTLKHDHEDRITKLKAEYETKLSAAQFASTMEMHEVNLSEKYDEMVKEMQAMRREQQQLETELENAKEALRKKEEGPMGERSVDAEANDPWGRLVGLGGGSNMVCYAPLAALSYWRRWRGRPDDVHTS